MISTAKWNELVHRVAVGHPLAAVTSRIITYVAFPAGAIRSHRIGYLYIHERLVLSKSLNSPGYHTGRSWTGHHIEDNCDCPQEPCGLVNMADADPSCEHHGMHSTKTQRQVHLATQCPGKDHQ